MFQAISRMDRILADTAVVGLETNIDFMRAVLNHQDLINADVYTDFIPDREKDLFNATFAPSMGEPKAEVGSGGCFP